MNNNFAIIVSEFNQHITEKLLEGAVTKLHYEGITEAQIHIVKVPGAVEIPLAAQVLAKSKKYHAIICLGAVIRGETSHYDYVCEQASHGCQRVMLDFNIPVIFGILTTETEKQALARVGGKEGHKGVEAAATAIYMTKFMETYQPAC